MAAGTAERPYLLRDHVGDEPVFIVIYEGNPNEGETAVECCTPLHADGAAPDGAATRTIPAHQEAYVRVLKRTVQSGAVGDVYVAIENWIEGQGLEIAAAPRETYWTDFYSAAADDEVFDVAFPVRVDILCGPSPAAEMTIGEFSRQSPAVAEGSAVV